MRNIFTLLFLGGICMPGAMAQTQDSVFVAQELDEVVVKAAKVIRKADMDLFFPSKSAIDTSKDGLQLLRNLMIPSLTVNDVLGTVTSSGQSVEVRINGRVSTMEQVRNLLPETIKKVEWIDNPGLRYGGANAVLNFIVANPDMGGSLMLQAMPALNSAWGNYNASLKLNKGRSQWGFSTHYKLTNKLGSHREYKEVFTFPDGERLTRTETPIDGHMSDSRIGMQLDYSYVKPDTTVLWITLHGHKQWPNATMYKGLMQLSNGLEDIIVSDYSGNKGFTPSFVAYFEQHFKHGQLLAIDFNASLYNGHSFHTYNEQETISGSPVAEVYTSIKDRNQAYGITADYIKNWNNSRFTAGVSYTANRNRSVYENIDDEVFHQTQDKVYFFGEYFRRINRVTLTAGLGAQYTAFHFRETDQGNSSWNLRPQFTATYSLNQSSQFRLNFTVWQSAPSLLETNIAPQQIDGFQWRVGNPDLKTSSSYMLTLRYNFTFPYVMGTLGVRAFTSPDAIAPFIEWHDDKLVTSYENSKGLSNITVFLSPQINIIPEWLMVSGTLQYRAERMKGHTYKHYNHNWSGDVTLLLQHWGFTLSAQYQKSQSDLWGEKISWGEEMSILGLSYDWRRWEFTAGVLCPFTKYDQGSKSLNVYNTNEMHNRLDMAPMPFIQLRYNMQWGRQKRDAQRLINADAEVSRSSASGR